MRNTKAILVKGCFNRIVDFWNGLPVAIRRIDQ